MLGIFRLRFAACSRVRFPRPQASILSLISVFVFDVLRSFESVFVCVNLVLKFSEINAPFVEIVVVVQADDDTLKVGYVLLQFAVFDPLIDQHALSWGGHGLASLTLSIASACA